MASTYLEKGLALAAALPHAEVDLIESVGRKCAFMERAADEAGISNARVVNTRSEEWAGGDGRESYDAVTARAVGRLSTLAELASPLLKDGGVLVAWKGKRDEEEEAAAGQSGQINSRCARSKSSTSAPTPAASTATST